MKKYSAGLVTHTHWDREWYFSVEEYRFRLVKMMDSLLDIIDGEKDYVSFWFDGQTIIIEDYLAVKDEKTRERLLKALKSKKILIGPWYVLADELLVSGEAFIRNLSKGIEYMRKHGQNNLVGYLPDTFGHISQVPQLFKGFGIDNAVFWRGYRLNEVKSSETFWKGADGTEIKAVCLVQGYSNTCGLERERRGDDKESFANQKERIDQTISVLKEKSANGRLLLMNGVDHAFPSGDIKGKIKRLHQKYRELSIRHISLPDYIKDSCENIKGAKILVGELDYRPGLDGTLSSRIWQKQMNRRLENLLIHYAEPLSLLSWLRKDSWQDGFLNRAWELLIKNHPHDSICGCHSNSVAESLAGRFRKSLEITETLISEAFAEITGVNKNETDIDAHNKIVFFNPLSWDVSRCGEFDVELPEKTDFIELSDGNKNFPCQILEKKEILRRHFYRHINPTVQNVVKYRVLTPPLSMESTSMKAFDIITGKNRSHLRKYVRAALSKKFAFMENDFIRVKIYPDGSLDMINKENGTNLTGINRLSIERDEGDLYCFKAEKENKKYYSFPGRISIIEKGPVEVKIKVETALKINDGKNPVTLYFKLKAEGKHCEIDTEIENRCASHRIQALFKLPEKFSSVYSHMPFDMAQRKPCPENDWEKIRSGKTDVECPEQAMQFVLGADSEDGSFFIANKGLYEFTYPGPGLLGITLLRSAGIIHEQLVIHDSSTGECIGKNYASYSLGFSVSGVSAILRAGYEFNLPSMAYQMPGKTDFQKSKIVSFSSSEWFISSIKRSCNGKGTLIRFFNAASGKTEGYADIHIPFTRVYQAAIDERKLKALISKRERVKISAGAKEIITLLIE
ncbi:MAG: hypothetical protein A2017_14785 [Lentisphaerae bacterium GWF2_44_16]|nr:MAG: hypothetical protein A2017_14785 [Lentisphaerae bacterium GWF2_44_16]